MTPSKTTPVVPWSYSSLTSFENCPRRHYLTRISKQVVEPLTDALTFGNKVHKELELATKGEKPLSAGFQSYQPLVDKLRAAPGHKLIEYKFGLTRGFEPVGFFDKRVWVRGAIDYAAVTEQKATVIDLKTGKPKVDLDQLRLFAATTLTIFPQLEQVKTGYIWLGYNKVDSENFVRGDEAEIWQDFAGRVIRMEKAQEKDEWPPRPSGLCGWCPVGSANCEFWKGTNGKGS